MPNIISSIGRSGAVGEFVKEARMMRANEANMAMQKEHLNLAKAQDEREGIKLGLDKIVTEEKIRAMQFEQQQKQKLWEEGDKDVLHNSELWGNKGVNSVAEEWFKSTGRGQMTPDGKLTYKNKHIKEFRDELEKNPLLQQNIAKADLKSAGTMLDKVKAAEEDKQSFQELKQMMPELTPEALPELRKFAEEDYLRAVRGFRGITLKDELTAGKKGGLGEVNVANEIDTILGGMFPGYYTDKNVREKALQWYATPEGSKAVQSKASEYNRSKAPPIYNIVPGYQTPEGAPIKMDVRGGTVSPATSSSNIQKTPSEGDVSEARKKTSIDAVIDEMQSAFDRADKALPKTPKSRIVGYPKRALSKVSQSDPNLVLADSLSSGFLAKFARAAGEVGTMTEGDINRASKLVPTVNDTKTVRDGKLKQARELYNEIYQRGKRQAKPLGEQKQSKETVMDALRKANPGTADTELEAYAKKKGYI